MNEKETAQLLESKWGNILEKDDLDELTKYLTENSNLPGPRANLGLANKLAELVTSNWVDHKKFLRRCIDSWGNDEYLRTCRNIVLGYIAAEHPQEDNWALDLLYLDNFNDEWRPREAVTIGLTESLRRRETYMLQLLHRWNEDNDLRVLRNTLVTLADPGNLRKSLGLREALRTYHLKAMDALRYDSNSKPGYQMLKKSLGFTLSVAAVEDPEMMRMLRDWVEADIKQWKSVLRSNLKKSRLVKKYPEQTRQLLARLDT
jgi:hypothetical protein